jgi:hypothetical protein
MISSDHMYFPQWWKMAGDKIILLGDFNKNVYTGGLATAPAGDQLRMSKRCNQITDTLLPSICISSRTPINAAFSTPSLLGSAAGLLPRRVGAGDHRAFIVGVESGSMLSDVFPWIILATHRLLKCALDCIKHNFIWVLNQLSNRHLIFKKLLTIDNKCNHNSPAQVWLHLNKVDLELEQFMKTVECNIHKFKHTHIE